MAPRSAAQQRPTQRAPAVGPSNRAKIAPRPCSRWLPRSRRRSWPVRGAPTARWPCSGSRPAAAGAAYAARPCRRTPDTETAGKLSAGSMSAPHAVGDLVDGVCQTFDRPATRGKPLGDEVMTGMTHPCAHRPQGIRQCPRGVSILAGKETWCAANAFTSARVVDVAGGGRASVHDRAGDEADNGPVTERFGQQVGEVRTPECTRHRGRRASSVPDTAGTRGRGDRQVRCRAARPPARCAEMILCYPTATRGQFVVGGCRQFSGR